MRPFNVKEPNEPEINVADHDNPELHYLKTGAVYDVVGSKLTSSLTLQYTLGARGLAKPVLAFSFYW